MTRIAVGLALLVAAEIALTTAALAQFAQLLPPPPRAPVGCMPGQYCPNTVQFGFRCLTPQFWCGLPQPGPVGTPCYCNSPMGPINGFVSQ
jgi:hypothetical protein